MDDISTASAVVLQDPIINHKNAASYQLVMCHPVKGPSIFLMQLGRGITFKKCRILKSIKGSQTWHLFAISTTEPFGTDATSKTHLSILLEQEPETLDLHIYDDKNALL